MNFFECQEKAKSRTGVLVILFGVAVVTFVLVMHGVLAVIFGVYESEVGAATSLWIPFVLLVIILGATLYKIVQLKQGGGYIASSLGGRRIDPGSTEPAERRLLNIVEEMAIASGIPVPPVYVLDRESGINAFAAGYEPADAVVAVTDGALRSLNREELQGVIAHEFSHIFNGDMRLNIRTIGVLNGILFFTVLGRIMLSVRSSRTPLPLVGLAFLIIGSIGVFFSKIIKFAISRQREYLADASAVQFTRNPMGLAGALKKIGGFTTGSLVKNPRAEEMSHLFFANGVSRWFDGLFSTHPPLEERIARLDPSFSGHFPKPEAPRPVMARRDDDASGLDLANVRFKADRPIPVDPEIVGRSVGNPGPEHFALSQEMLASIPRELFDMARRAGSARQLIYALLLSKNKEIAAKQLEVILQEASQADMERITALLDARPEMWLKIPLVDLSIPALTKLTVEEFSSFRKTISRLIEIDGNTTLFEYVLQKMVIRHVAIALSPGRAPRSYYKSIVPVLPSFTTLLSILAYYGTSDMEKASFAFEMARLRLGVKEPLSIIPRTEATLSVLDGSLDVLSNLSLPLKKQILEAAVATVATDGQVTIEEAELLRCIADCLDCPMPPIVPGPVGATAAG